MLRDPKGDAVVAAIRRARERDGAAVVARLAGVTPAAVRKWCNGVNDIDPGRLADLWQTFCAPAPTVADAGPGLVSRDTGPGTGEERKAAPAEDKPAAPSLEQDIRELVDSARAVMKAAIADPIAPPRDKASAVQAFRASLAQAHKFEQITMKRLRESPECERLCDSILDALEPFADARAAVEAALRKLEDEA